METVRIEADSSQLVGALERLLPQYGYRTLRSFDLPLSTSAVAAEVCKVCPEHLPDGCACRYTVLLALPRAGPGQAETIAVLGKGGSSTLTLLSSSGDSELAAQFALLLTEALRVSTGAESSNGTAG